MIDYAKYQPTPEGLHAEFYRRARGGILHLQKCGRCDRFQHPPRYYCAACGSAGFVWSPSRGLGQLFSWTVTHIVFDRGWSGDIPYATGIIELDEGVRLVGALQGIAYSNLAIGLPLTTRLEPKAGDFVFVSFVSAEGHDAK